MKFLTGMHGKIPRPTFDATDQMSNQIVRTFFFTTLLFLLGEDADRIAYDFGLALPSPTRQPADQRLRLCVQPNTQRHVTPSRNVIHNCTTATVVYSMAAHCLNTAAVQSLRSVQCLAAVQKFKER